jgi:predicted acyl esterase
LPTNTKTPLHLAELGGTKRWINARNYPIVETYTPLYLAAGGKLEEAPAAADAQDQVSWVPDGFPGGSIEYQSQPFTKGAMLAGPTAARLQVASSNSNLQLSVDVFDRSPNGTRTKITHGGILGSLRETQAPASWTDKNGLPVRPYLALDQDESLTPGKPAELDVPLWPSVWSIEPGHSIVVRIATQPASGDCGGLLALPVGCNLTDPARNSLTGGVYTLHRGGKMSSLISLPLLEHGALTTTEAAVSPTGKLATPPPPGAVEYPLPVDW